MKDGNVLDATARSVVERSVQLWWFAASAVALAAVFAFPFYKDLPLGLLPVMLGIAVAFTARHLPVRAIQIVDRLFSATSDKAWVYFILILGCGLRAVVVAYPPEPTSDHAVYLEVARGLLGGKGFGDLIFWPPGQPAVVAFGIVLAGDSPRALAGFHALIGLLTSITLYFGFRSYSETAARWSSLVAACWPSLVLWNSTLGHETTTLLVFAIVVLLTFRLANVNRSFGFLFCFSIGVVAGLMALIRPTALAIPFLIGIFLWLHNRNFWRSLARSALIAIIMVSVISPWTIRNFIKFDEFCPISANAGNVLLSANHPASDGIYYALPHITSLKPCERDRFRGQQALQIIASDPTRFALLTMKRLTYMWGTDTSGLDFVLGSPPRGGDQVKKGLSFLMQTAWGFFVAAWFIAAWFPSKIRERASSEVDWTFVLLWCALTWLTHAIVEPLARHHLPLIPFLAAIVMPRYWAWLSRPRQQRR